MEKTESVAIPFIKYDAETQGFQVAEEAIEFLSEIKGSVGVISLCGKYRTGKSYLLNKLFLENLRQKKQASMNQEKQEAKAAGFQVGPTINACTKGLWIWREIFYSDTDTDK
jgi:hypothetical protein